MIITFPFVKGVTDYTALADRMRITGPFKTHILHVVCQECDIADATEFFDSFEDHFLGSKLGMIQENPDRTKIKLANDLFQLGAKMANEHKRIEGEAMNAPFMYYDPVSLPKISSWAETVQTEFIQYGKKVLGNPVKGKTLSLTTNGEPVEIEGGMIFRSNIVLRANFYETSTMITNLTAETHWREAMAYEFGESYAVAETMGKGRESEFKMPSPPAKKREPVIPPPPKEKTIELEGGITNEN